MAATMLGLRGNDVTVMKQVSQLISLRDEVAARSTRKEARRVGCAANG